MYTHTSSGLKGMVLTAMFIAVVEVVMLPFVLGFVDALCIGWLCHESFFAVPILRYGKPVIESHFLAASMNPQLRFIVLMQGVLVVMGCLTIINIIGMYAFLLRLHFPGAISAMVRILVGAALIVLTVFLIALAGSGGFAEEAIICVGLALVAFVTAVALLGKGIEFFNPEQPAHAAQ
jgi:hypothetical protein